MDSCAPFLASSRLSVTDQHGRPTIVKGLGYSAARAQLFTVPPYAVALVFSAYSTVSDFEADKYISADSYQLFGPRSLPWHPSGLRVLHWHRWMGHSARRQCGQAYAHGATRPILRMHLHRFRRLQRHSPYDGLDRQQQCPRVSARNRTRSVELPRTMSVNRGFLHLSQH